MDSDCSKNFHKIICTASYNYPDQSDIATLHICNSFQGFVEIVSQEREDEDTWLNDL